MTKYLGYIDSMTKGIYLIGLILDGTYIHTVCAEMIIVLEKQDRCLEKMHWTL